MAAPVKRGRKPRSGPAQSPEQWPAGPLRSGLARNPASSSTNSGRALSGGHSGSTVELDRTMLYVGTSSDQDVYLLRHLPFDDRNRFGHANWRVCKVLAHEFTPAYFTVWHTSALSLWG